MSANSKFGKLTGRGQPRPVPSAKRAVAPSRLGGVIKDTGALGSGKGTIGGNSTGNGGVTANSLEESYQLIPSGLGTCPPFAMMIRLTPEILEELKRVEAEGGKSVMKFGANASGHMIKVGHEDLKFSSVSEPGELCDIYEQQRTGEDGQGLLVEAGSVWRKLSVQRTLSASEKDRVKKRSEEAERKQRLRKAIVLDHSTPPMKNQAAVPGEVNGRRPPLKIMKEPPPKKRKVATSPVAPAPKPRPQFIAPPMENARNTSPAPSSPEPSNINFRGLSMTQKGCIHPLKGRHVAEEGVSGPSVNKGNVSVQKEKGLISASVAMVDGGGPAKAGLSGNNMTELRNFLITLLKENPKGMTIKAVEKAIGEAMPCGNPGRKNIEKVIKSIASYHAPGKYLLNQGVEKGNFLKPSPGSGSSPETALAESPLSAGSPLQPDHTETASKPENKSPIHEARQRQGGGVGRAVNVDNGRGSSQGGLANSYSGVANKEFGRKRNVTEVHEIMLNADVEQGVNHQIPTPMLHEDEQQCSGLKMAQPSDAWLFTSSKSSEGQISSPKPNAAETKAVDSEGSDTSSSSGSGSETDSDTDSSESGSGSDTGSGSGSGSDSEPSSSSSEENMDEDVDIISEDENVNKSDARQRSRVKEVKSLPHRPDGRIQREELHNVEGRDNKHKLTPDEMPFTSRDSAKSSEDVDIGDATEGGEINKIANDIVEKVFGPDEVNVVVDVDANLCEGYVKSPCKSESRASAMYNKQDGNESPMSSEGRIKSYEDNTACSQKSRSKVDHRRLNNNFESKHSNGYIETKTERNGKHQGRSVPSAEKVRSEEGKSDTLGPRVGMVVSQREEHGSLLVSIMDRGAEKRLLGPENKLCIVSKIGQKEHCNDIETNGGVSNKGRSMGVEPSMKQSAVSPIRAKESSQHIEKPSIGDGLSKQKPSMDVRKNSAKDMGPVEKYRKDGQHQVVRRKNNDNLSKGKIEDLQKSAWGHDPSSVSARNLETFSKLPEGELTSNKAETMPKNSRTAEQSQTTRKDEDTAVKDKINGVNISRYTKPEKSLERLSNNIELQRYQENDTGLLGKPGKGLGSSNRPFKGVEQSSGCDRELVQADKVNRDHLKVARSMKQSDEVKKTEMIERADLVVEQAERPLRENDSSKRPKTTNFKDTLKEAEPIGRPEFDSVNNQADRALRENDSYRRPKITNLKDTLKEAEPVARPELDGVSARASIREGTLSSSRDGKKYETDNIELERSTYTGAGAASSLSHRNLKRNCSDLELGEFRKPALEEEPQEELKSFYCNEDAQSRQNSEAPSKVFFKKENASFEIAKSQTIVKERPDMKNASPVKYGIDAGKFLQDPKSGKRRLDGDEVADSARTYKKLAIPQGHKQHFPCHQGKNDIDGLGKPTSTEATRLITSDGQDNTVGSSKLFVVESTHKQVDKKGPITDKKKPDTTIPVTIEIKSENPATDHFQKHPKKQTPNSMEVQAAEFFAPYEKKEAELRGPIKTYEQYKEYCKEYHEKYPIYIRLNTALQSDKEDFESFQREIDLAKSKDDKSKLDSIYGKVRKDYYQCRKRFKRMRRTFLLLHDDLKDIKQKCKEFAEKQGQG